MAEDAEREYVIVRSATDARIVGPGLVDGGVLQPVTLAQTQDLLSIAYEAGVEDALRGVAFGFFGMWAHEYVRVAAVALVNESERLPMADALAEIANRMEAAATAHNIDVARDRFKRCMDPFKQVFPAAPRQFEECPNSTADLEGRA